MIRRIFSPATTTRSSCPLFVGMLLFLLLSFLLQILVIRVEFVDAAACTVADDCSSHASSVSGDRPNCQCSCDYPWASGDCSVCPSGFVIFSGTFCTRVCTIPLDCNDHASTVQGFTHTGCTCQCRNQWRTNFSMLNPVQSENTQPMISRAACQACDIEYDPTRDCSACNVGFVQTTYPNCWRPCNIQNDCAGRALQVSGDWRDCQCDCANHWEIPRCQKCPFPYGGANCSECFHTQDQLTYPNCWAKCTIAGNCSGNIESISRNNSECVCHCRNEWQQPNLHNCSYCPKWAVEHRDCVTRTPSLSLSLSSTLTVSDTESVTLTISRSKSINTRTKSTSPSESFTKSLSRSYQTASRSSSMSLNSDSESITHMTEATYSGNSPTQSNSLSLSVEPTHTSTIVVCWMKDCGAGTNHTYYHKTLRRCVCSCRTRWQGEKCDICPSSFNNSISDCKVCSLGFINNTDIRIPSLLSPGEFLLGRCDCATHFQMSVTVNTLEAPKNVTNYIDVLSNDIKQHISKLCFGIKTLVIPYEGTVFLEQKIIENKLEIVGVTPVSSDGSRCVQRRAAEFCFRRALGQKCLPIGLILNVTMLNSTDDSRKYQKCFSDVVPQPPEVLPFSPCANISTWICTKATELKIIPAPIPSYLLLYILFAVGALLLLLLLAALLYCCCPPIIAAWKKKREEEKEAELQKKKQEEEDEKARLAEEEKALLAEQEGEDEEYDEEWEWEEGEEECEYVYEEEEEETETEQGGEEEEEENEPTTKEKNKNENLSLKSRSRPDLNWSYKKSDRRKRNSNNEFDDEEEEEEEEEDDDDDENKKSRFRRNKANFDFDINDEDPKSRSKKSKLKQRNEIDDDEEEDDDDNNNENNKWRMKRNKANFDFDDNDNGGVRSNKKKKRITTNNNKPQTSHNYDDFEEDDGENSNNNSSVKKKNNMMKMKRNKMNFDFDMDDDDENTNNNIGGNTNAKKRMKKNRFMYVAPNFDEDLGTIVSMKNKRKSRNDQNNYLNSNFNNGNDNTSNDTNNPRWRMQRNRTNFDIDIPADVENVQRQRQQKQKQSQSNQVTSGLKMRKPKQSYKERLEFDNINFSNRSNQFIKTKQQQNNNKNEIEYDDDVHAKSSTNANATTSPSSQWKRTFQKTRFDDFGGDDNNNNNNTNVFSPTKKAVVGDVEMKSLEKISSSTPTKSSNLSRSMNDTAQPQNDLHQYDDELLFLLGLRPPSSTAAAAATASTSLLSSSTITDDNVPDTTTSSDATTSPSSSKRTKQRQQQRKYQTLSAAELQKEYEELEQRMSSSSTTPKNKKQKSKSKNSLDEIEAAVAIEVSASSSSSPSSPSPSSSRSSFYSSSPSRRRLTWSLEDI